MIGLNKIAGVVVAALIAAPVWAAELVMVQEDGCVWCVRWNTEIAPAYPKTAEGRFAPLRRVEIDAIPDDITPLRPINFTPTFLIVQDGQELSRIEGYPGEHWFWPILARLLQDTTEFSGENG